MVNLLSALPILIAAVLSGLTIVGQHYFPWRKWLRKELPRLAAYSMGTLAILIPYTFLMIYWQVTASNTPVWLAALALWTVTGAAGLLTGGCYWIDSYIDKSLRCTESETREQHYREKLGV